MASMGAPPDSIALAIDSALRALPERSSAQAFRAVRRQYSRIVRAQPGAFVLDVGRALVQVHGRHWWGYELVRYHQRAFALVGETELNDFGRGINSWGTVDAFARLLSGPAWLHRQIPDRVIHGWARFPDRWWRRAALVSTVALNVRSHGGTGDPPRTLAVCGMLVRDRDDLIVKAMSWALRALVVHDPGAVGQFLAEHDEELAARIKREVHNKLDTGLKNPRRGAV